MDPEEGFIKDERIRVEVDVEVKELIGFIAPTKIDYFSYYSESDCKLVMDTKATVYVNKAVSSIWGIL